MSQSNGSPCVYFVGAVISGDIALVKIGRGNTRTRLAAIRTSCPHQVLLMAEVDTHDPPRLEAELHRRFSAHRKEGEWFVFDDEIKYYLNEELETE